MLLVISLMKCFTIILCLILPAVQCYTAYMLHKLTNAGVYMQFSTNQESDCIAWCSQNATAVTYSKHRRTCVISKCFNLHLTVNPMWNTYMCCKFIHLMIAEIIVIIIKCLSRALWTKGLTTYLTHKREKVKISDAAIGIFAVQINFSMQKTSSSTVKR